MARASRSAARSTSPAARKSTASKEDDAAPAAQVHKPAQINGNGMTANEIIGVAVFAAAAYTFYLHKSRTPPADKSAAENTTRFLKGMFFSVCALIGNTGVSALRKILSAKKVVGHAEQVGFACLVQGIGQASWLFYSAPKLEIPGYLFWMAAIASSLLGAAVKTLETKAFAESDMSLCAPFLAFDPVMQLVVGSTFFTAICVLTDLPEIVTEVTCGEKKDLPVHHVLSVFAIAVGAFLLAQAAKRVSDAEGKKDGKKDKIKYYGPFPLGSWIILGNCVIYGFSSRFDKVAIHAGKLAVGPEFGKLLYNALNRLIMAATTLGGTVASGRSLSVEVLFKPDVSMLMLGICACEVFYMLTLYEAMDTISPVYVTAMKRGGGVLVSSLTGILLFNENLTGRIAPILMIVSAVAMMIV